MHRLSETINAIVSERTSGSVGVAIRLRGSADGRIDIDSGRAFPAASISKLLVLLSLLVDAEDGRINLDTARALDRREDVGGYGVLSQLPSITQLSPRELATLMVTCSDNTATNALIGIIGLDRMSEVATTLGLRSCRLQRRLMDLEAEKRGARNEIGAADAAQLIETLVDPGVLSAASCTIAHEMLLRQHYRDRLPRRTDPQVEVANKTGDLPGLRHDVAVMRAPDATAYVAVLTNDFDDPRTQHCLDGGDASELIAAVGQAVAAHLVEGSPTS